MTHALVDWIGGVLPGTTTQVRPLGARERTAGIDLRLVAAAPRPVPRTDGRVAIVDLDYLLTVQLDDALAEQRAVVELLFAAAARPDCEVVGDRDVAALCTAIGVGVAPGLVLRTALMREQAEPPTRRVEHPLVVRTADLGAIEGVVLAADDVPVADAAVSIEGSSPVRTVRTDRHGRFRIAGAPRVAAGITLVARARGGRSEACAVAGQSVTLRLSLEN